MYDLKWSHAEKKLAHEVFERALDAELTETIAEFKIRAASVSTPEELWSVRGFLASRQREIEEKYDYRYSQLIVVFSRLIREGRVREEELTGLPTRSYPSSGASCPCSRPQPSNSGGTVSVKRFAPTASLRSEFSCSPWCTQVHDESRPNPSLERTSTGWPLRAVHLVALRGQPSSAAQLKR